MNNCFRSIILQRTYDASVCVIDDDTNNTQQYPLQLSAITRIEGIGCSSSF